MGRAREHSREAVRFINRIQQKGVTYSTAERFNQNAKRNTLIKEQSVDSKKKKDPFGFTCDGLSERAEKCWCSGVVYFIYPQFFLKCRVRNTPGLLHAGEERGGGVESTYRTVVHRFKRLSGRRWSCRRTSALRSHRGTVR